jgi:hypothetical protein
MSDRDDREALELSEYGLALLSPTSKVQASARHEFYKSTQNPHQHDNTKRDTGPRPQKCEERVSNPAASDSKHTKILDIKCASNVFLNTAPPHVNACHYKYRSR